MFKLQRHAIFIFAFIVLSVLTDDKLDQKSVAKSVAQAKSDNVEYIKDPNTGFLEFLNLNMTETLLLCISIVNW